MARSRWIVAFLLALAGTIGILLAPPATLADNAVTGKLAASPNPSTPEADLWTFLGPADGSTVTLSLTYSPNGDTLDSTGQSFDRLAGFNVYGDDGKLFGQSALVSAGVRQWSFQSSSVHQYTVQVFNYIESTGITYTLTAQNVTLSGPPVAAPTPTVPAPAAAAPPMAQPTPLPAITTVERTPGVVPLLPAVLAKAGDSIQGSLIGTATNAVQDYRVQATADGSPITVQLTAQQGDLMSSTLAGVNIYQLQYGLKVLIAVGLPAPDNADVSAALFPGNNGLGDFIAEVYNGAPGALLTYTLSRS